VAACLPLTSANRLACPSDLPSCKRHTDCACYIELVSNFLFFQFQAFDPFPQFAGSRAMRGREILLQVIVYINTFLCQGQKVGPGAKWTFGKSALRNRSFGTRRSAVVCGSRAVPLGLASRLSADGLDTPASDFLSDSLDHPYSETS
jgi:hypothetical protein